MKIWYQHGSEHSANLVMIGHFKDISGATKAKEIIDLLTEQVLKDVDDGILVLGSPSERYGKEMLELLARLKTASIRSQDLEDFAYCAEVETKENKIVITTEELSISAFLNVMINLGARIEVYSAHDYPDSDYGRRK